MKISQNFVAFSEYMNFIALTIIKQTSRVLLLCWFFFWLLLLLLLLFFSSSLLDRERLSGLPGKGRSSGRRPTRGDGGGILSATATGATSLCIEQD